MGSFISRGREAFSRTREVLRTNAKVTTLAGYMPPFDCWMFNVQRLREVEGATWSVRARIRGSNSLG